MRERYKPDKVMTELRHKLETANQRPVSGSRDQPMRSVEEADSGDKVSSLRRGLDGRIVMEIKDDQEHGQEHNQDHGQEHDQEHGKGHGGGGQQPRVRRSLVETVIGSLGKKKRREKKEFSDSASR